MIEWDTDTRRATAAIAGHRARVTACVYLGSGRFCATSPLDGTIKVWCLTSGTCLHCARHDRPMSCIAVAGNTLVAGDSLGTLSVFELNLPRVLE